MKTVMPDDAKKKYEALAGKTLTDTQLVDNLENRLKEVEAELSKFVSSVTKSINRLDEIALRPTNTSCSAYIDVLIAKVFSFILSIVFHVQSAFTQCVLCVVTLTNIYQLFTDTGRFRCFISYSAMSQMNCGTLILITVATNLTKVEWKFNADASSKLLFNPKIYQMAVCFQNENDLYGCCVEEVRFAKEVT